MSQTMIFLYGPPGSGKSTVGRILADNLRLSFHDLDGDIENRSGYTVAQIFSQRGESGFREMERQEVERLFSLGKAVVALGGGSLTVSAVRTLIENNGQVLCLGAAPGVLLDRLRSDQVQRPLLAGDVARRLAEVINKRAEHYASFPLQLDTTLLDPTQAAREAQILLGRFYMGNSSPPYEACVQPGGLNTIGQALIERGIQSPLAVVADSNTAPLYALRLCASLKSSGVSHTLMTIPAGESNKTVASAQKLWDKFLSAGLERSSIAIALGGGVIGDLTGFAASTYMRGIQWVDVPTTLLAMIDSSLGGKTGVDIPNGKNLIGTFHSPAFVLADPELLATLPEVEFRSGLAEVVKHAVIADPGLLELCTAFKLPGGHPFSSEESLSSCTGRGLTDLVSRSMAVKVGIIEADPYEKGIRAALNLGHTVGHALEVVSGYTLRHGEAVAIGMVIEARLAERLGLAERGLSLHIAKVLAQLDLPVTIPANLDRDAIRLAIGTDKKKERGVVRFVLPIQIGRVQVGIDVPANVLMSEI